MRRYLLVALAVVLAVSGTTWAHADYKVGGYMAPNFRMIDKGEDNASNMGFGMSFNRFLFKGEVEGGAIMKNIAWRVETDISQTGSHALQWAFVQPKFNDIFSLKLGHMKKPFSREILHATSNLLTVDRLVSSGSMGLGFGGFNYGLEAHVKHEMFKLHAGAYSGKGADKHAKDQDPCMDFGIRGILTPPVEGLEIGANVVMLTLPEGGSNQGAYVDSDSFLTNSAIAFGADVDYQMEFSDGMGLWAQAEFGMGDNWDSNMGGGADAPAVDDTWEDYSWYSFRYFYFKARFMVNEDFGLHAGFSVWDPNACSDDAMLGTTTVEVGENDETSTITPGIVYYWAKNLRTQAEVQLITEKKHALDADGNWIDNDYTHFVLQTVFVW